MIVIERGSIQITVSHGCTCSTVLGSCAKCQSSVRVANIKLGKRMMLRISVIITQFVTCGLLVGKKRIEFLCSIFRYSLLTPSKVTGHRT